MKRVFSFRCPTDLHEEIERIAEKRGESPGATAIDLLRFAIASERLEGAIVRLEQRLDRRIASLENSFSAVEQGQGRHATAMRDINARLETIGHRFQDALQQVEASVVSNHASTSFLGNQLETFQHGHLSTHLNNLENLVREIRQVLSQVFGR